MSTIEPDKFYQEASRRILGTMQLERAIRDCLLYLREFIPAEFFGVHFFDPGLGVVETVVNATAESAEIISRITTLGPEARQLIQAVAEERRPDCIVIERLCEDEMARQLGLDFDSPDSPCLAMDLVVDDVFLGFVSVSCAKDERYLPEHAALLMTLHDPLAMACSQFRRYRDLARLREILADNARQLQKDMMQGVGDEVVGAEFGLKAVMSRVTQVAAQNSSVLLLGETGVGKEVVAWAVHRLSPRREGPFIKINCGAIPSGLIESELFGHEKGAFTGAISRRRGCFERADGGTLLLDEIGELPLDAQVRLLTVLQDRRVERIGAAQTERVDVRVIAATNRDLSRMVADGAFRRDLFFRLNVFPIEIPPLRERKLDIPALARHLILKKARAMGLARVPETEPGAIDRLTSYDWPGNVRELENVIERELILRPAGPLSFSSFSNSHGGPANGEAPVIESTQEASLRLDDVMVRHITRVLERTRGRVEGPNGAAELLDVNPRTLQYRMKKLGVPFGRKAGNLYD